MFVNKFSLQKVTHNGFSWRLCWGRDFLKPSSIFVQEKSRSFVESCCHGDGRSVSTTRSSTWIPIFFRGLFGICVHIGVAAAYISVKEMIPNVFFCNFGAQVQEILTGLDLPVSVHFGRNCDDKGFSYMP